MQPLKAHVRNGRIFLDAPTDQVQLVPVQPRANFAANDVAGDGLDDPLMDASDAVADLRAVR